MRVSSVVSALAGLVAALGARGMNGTTTDVVSWPDIIEWFTSRRNVKVGNPDVVAFTYLRRPLKPGAAEQPPLSIERRSKARVILIQGLFDQRVQELRDCRVIEANEMDAECSSAHGGNEIVIYE